MSWLRIEPRSLRGDASTLEKSHSNSLLIADPNILHINAWPVENAHNMPPPMCYIHEHTWTTWTALGFRPNSTCKASAKHLSCQDISTCKSMYSLSNRTDHVGVTTKKRLDQGHLRPKWEVPDIPAGKQTQASVGNHSLKEPFEGLLIAAENLHMSERPVQNASDNIFFLSISSNISCVWNLYSSYLHGFISSIWKKFVPFFNFDDSIDEKVWADVKLFFYCIILYSINLNCYKFSVLFIEKWWKLGKTLFKQFFVTFILLKVQFLLQLLNQNYEYWSDSRIRNP
jgi:hypothetical protein